MKKIILIFLLLFNLISCRKIINKEVNSNEYQKLKTLYLREIKNDKVKLDSTERREKFISKRKYISSEKRNLILAGKIAIGMYKEEVLSSIGEPESINKKNIDFGIKEEWKYLNKILYFENGVLIDIFE